MVHGDANWAIGLMDGSQQLSGYYLGSTGDSIALYPLANPHMCFWRNNAIIVSTGGVTVGSEADGAVLDMAWNADTHRLFLRSPAMVAAFGAHAWNNNSNADPTTGSGGIDTSVLGTGQLWPACGLAGSGTAALLIVDAASLADLVTLLPGYAPLA